MLKLNSSHFYHLLTFPFFFSLFYVESLDLGGIKFAIVWKIILIAFMIFYMTVNLTKLASNRIVSFGYLYSVKNFITISSSQYLVAASTEALKSAVIPLIFHFFNVINRGIYFNDRIYRFILVVSVYIILSSIPFLLDIITPLGDGYDLSIFGSNDSGFVGIFQTAHSAAVTIAFALVVLIYQVHRPIHRIAYLFYVALIILGIWIEIKTYARTGFAVLLIGATYLIFRGKRFVFYLKLAPFLFLGCFVVWQYYLSSDILQMRLSGTNIYLEESSKSSKVEMDSGRLSYGLTALTNLYNSGPLAWCIGYGDEQAKNLMLSAIGLHIYAHNGYIDALQFNGLIGAILYLMFIFYCISYIRKQNAAKYVRLTWALLLCYLVQMLFQGEHFFLPDVMFAMSLVCVGNIPKKEQYFKNDSKMFQIERKL